MIYVRPFHNCFFEIAGKSNKSVLSQYNTDTRLFISAKHDKLYYCNLSDFDRSRNYHFMNDPNTILSSWAEFRLNPPSDYLLNCLLHIHDATDIHGEHVFSPRVSTLITTMIASRSYGQELYRLCGFMAMASGSGINPAELLLGGKATAARVNKLFDDAVIPDDIHMADRHIVLASHNPPYQIDMARIPVILGLATFICDALGFDIFINLYERLGKDRKMPSVRAISNDLSKQMYRFLGNHLPRSSERKISMLLQDYMLDQLSKDSKITSDDVDDHIILNFWKEKSIDPELSLKLYDTCLRAWMTFRQGLDLADRASSNPDSLDSNDYRLDDLALSCFNQSDEDMSIADAGPKMMQSSDTWLHDDHQTMQSAYHELAKPPLDTIKILNNGEREKINLLVHADTHATALRRSILRGTVFSQAQNKITQALRDHPDRPVNIAGIMPDKNQSAYSVWTEEWQNIHAVAKGTLRTACQRLIEARSMHGLQILMRVLSDHAKSELASLMKNSGFTKTPDHFSIENIFSVLDDSKSAVILKKELAEIKTTARAYRRSGLRQPPAGINDLEVWHDNLHQAAELTDTIIAALENFLAQLAITEDLYDQFKEDHSTFSDQFSKIYQSEGNHD